MWWRWRQGVRFQSVFSYNKKMNTLIHVWATFEMGLMTWFIRKLKTLSDQGIYVEILARSIFSLLALTNRQIKSAINTLDIDDIIYIPPPQKKVPLIDSRSPWRWCSLCLHFIISAVNRCELNCEAEGGIFYHRHAAHVVDGTKCNEDGTDICVGGRCEVSRPGWPGIWAVKTLILRIMPDLCVIALWLLLVVISQRHRCFLYIICMSY